MDHALDWSSMWFDRDIEQFLRINSSLPIKILKGPRQVGKTSLLEHLKTHSPVYFDDLQVRRRAEADPRFFFDQMGSKLILDEATLVPEVFSELKRRVDESRRVDKKLAVDYWITGSNQTLLQRAVRESLAGRASYYDLNTLSWHELPHSTLEDFFFRGGWPELRKDSHLNSTRYLNDFIATFIEKDIVVAAGIERRDAFAKCLHLTAARIGQLWNSADVARDSGVDATTLQSWISLLQQNGVLMKLPAYSSNLNSRLIKTPKIYFEDVALATRLQGWVEFKPLYLSSQFGFLLENLAITEVARSFTNRGLPASLFYLRSKEKVEVDLVIELPNQQFIVAEVKATPNGWTKEQHALVDSLKIKVVERWIISPQRGANFKGVRAIEFKDIFDEIGRLLPEGS